MADKIIDSRDEKQDSEGKTYILDVIAYIVPGSEQFPSGVKYSFQAVYKETEELIMRYDNANDSHAAKHHKHIIKDAEETTEPLGLQPENAKQLHKLFQKWIEEVKQNVG